MFGFDTHYVKKGTAEVYFRLKDKYCYYIIVTNNSKRMYIDELHPTCTRGTPFQDITEEIVSHIQEDTIYWCSPINYIAKNKYINIPDKKFMMLDSHTLFQDNSEYLIIISHLIDFYENKKLTDPTLSKIHRKYIYDLMYEIEGIPFDYLDALSQV